MSPAARRQRILALRMVTLFDSAVSTRLRKDVRSLGPGPPLCNQRLNTFRLLLGQVVELHSIVGQIVKLPCAPLRSPDNLPVANADGSVSFMLPGQKIVANCPVAEGGNEALGFKRVDFVARALRGIPSTGYFDAGWHDVDQVTDLTSKFAAVANAGWPVH